MVRTLNCETKPFKNNADMRFSFKFLLTAKVIYNFVTFFSEGTKDGTQ